MPIISLKSPCEDARGSGSLLHLIHSDNFSSFCTVDDLHVPS